VVAGAWGEGEQEPQSAVERRGAAGADGLAGRARGAGGSAVWAVGAADAGGVGGAGTAGGVAVHPHTLRHTLAKNLVDAGVGLHEVAALLGHSSLNTTRVYVTPGERDLEQAVRRLEG
jgi:integrase